MQNLRKDFLKEEKIILNWIMVSRITGEEDPVCTYTWDPK